MVANPSSVGTVIQTSVGLSDSLEVIMLSYSSQTTNMANVMTKKVPHNALALIIACLSVCGLYRLLVSSYIVVQLFNACRHV